MTCCATGEASLPVRLPATFSKVENWSIQYCSNMASSLGMIPSWRVAKANTPTRVLGLKLGRTPDAVQPKASAEQLSLKPTNQSPYGTKK